METVNRRHFFTKTFALGATLMGAAGLHRASAEYLTGVETFKLPPLPYAYDALEPTIEAEIMRLHHDKHHAGYVRKVNAALDEVGAVGRDLVDILKNLDSLPADVRASVRQNGGGALNHALFWEVMSPDGGGEPAGELASAITETFGSFSDFREQFSQTTGGVFGSGWGWLSVDFAGKLFISKTPNQNNPLMTGYVERTGIPILGLDVWEHAYYLQYQNRRGDYIDAWWNVVDWANVALRYSAALRGEMIADPIKA